MARKEAKTLYLHPWGWVTHYDGRSVQIPASPNKEAIIKARLAFLFLIHMMSMSVSAQTGGSERPAEKDGTKILDPKICRPDASSPGIAAAQSALGLGLGVVGGILGYQMDRDGMGVGPGLGYVAGTSMGIWTLGKVAGGRGNLGLTMLGLWGGALGGILLSGLVGDGAAPFILAGASNLGALGAYHLSNGSFRTRLECREGPGSGGKSARLKIGADLVLARW